MNAAEVRHTVQAALDARGKTQYRAALDAKLPENAIRYLLEGRDIKFGRLIQIADALGLDLHIGPSRERLVSVSTPEKKKSEPLPSAPLDALQDATHHILRLAYSAGADPLPADLHEKVIDQVLPDLEVAVPVEDLVGDPPYEASLLSVPILPALAGAGWQAMDETPVLRFPLPQWYVVDWARASPRHCVIVGVRGDSMAPTLPHGCHVLIDRSDRSRRRSGRLYLFRVADEGLVIRRFVRLGGTSLLTSDNPEIPDVPYARGIETVGRLCCMAWLLR